MAIDPNNPVVDLPAEKALPEDVRRMLKSINPMVDAFYVGNGTWYILEYQPHSARRITIVAKLERLRANPHARQKDLTAAQLQYDGWALLFPFHSELGDYPNSWCLGELQRIMAVTRKQMEDVEEQLIRDSSGETLREAKDAHLRDYAQTEGKTFFHIEIGNRVSVNTLPGQVGLPTAAAAAGSP